MSFKFQLAPLHFGMYFVNGQHRPTINVVTGGVSTFRVIAAVGRGVLQGSFPVRVPFKKQIKNPVIDPNIARFMMI